MCVASTDAECGVWIHLHASKNKPHRRVGPVEAEEEAAEDEEEEVEERREVREAGKEEAGQRREAREMMEELKTTDQQFRSRATVRTSDDIFKLQLAACSCCVCLTRSSLRLAHERTVESPLPSSYS